MTIDDDGGCKLRWTYKFPGSLLQIVRFTFLEVNAL